MKMGPILALFLACFLILSSPSPALSDQSGDHLTSKSELLALYSLRSTLGLRARNWPRGSDPCLAWTGVSCQSGRVVGLDIAGLKRTRLGRLNPRFDVTGLQHLSRLNRFNASGFLLPGSIPDWFGSRLPPSFSILDLSGSGVTGEIPNSLGNLSSLTILDLSCNQLRGHIPDTFWSLSQLSVLDLSSNGLSGELPVLPPSIRSSMTKKVVILSSNLYYGKIPSNFATFFSHLDLSDNYFDGTIPIRNNSISASLNCFSNATDQRAPSDCISFYSSRGLPYLGPTLPAQHSSKRKRHIKLKYILIAAISCGTLLLLLALISVLYCLFFRSNSRRQSPDTENSNNQEQQPGNGPGPITETIINMARLETDGAHSQSAESFVTDGGTHFASPVVTPGESYSYDQLLRATSGFSDENLIHQGHTGDFYQGRLDDGTRVAVKRVGPTVVDRAGCLAAELDVLAKGMNRRLVELMGHCLEGEVENFLVYRMVKYGDLASVFHRKPCVEKGEGQDEVKSLDWITRLKIATGLAQALCYLHCECDPPIVHGDVQASSILLDDKFEVRLASLSDNCVENTPNVISRVVKFSLTQAKASLTNDIHNLGLVLLELITGQSGRASSDWLNLVLPCIDNDNKELISQMVDPFLTVDEDHMDEVWGVALLAKSCLNCNPEKRPSIRDVVKALENPLKVVREDSRRKLRAMSARGSWNSAFWSSDVYPAP